MGKREDEFVMILDIDKVFSGEELALVSRGGGEDTLGLEDTDGDE